MFTLLYTSKLIELRIFFFLVSYGENNISYPGNNSNSYYNHNAQIFGNAANLTNTSSNYINPASQFNNYFYEDNRMIENRTNNPYSYNINNNSVPLNNIQTFEKVYYNSNYPQMNQNSNNFANGANTSYSNNAKIPNFSLESNKNGLNNLNHIKNNDRNAAISNNLESIRTNRTNNLLNNDYSSSKNILNRISHKIIKKSKEVNKIIRRKHLHDNHSELTDEEQKDQKNILESLSSEEGEESIELQINKPKIILIKNLNNEKQNINSKYANVFEPLSPEEAPQRLKVLPFKFDSQATNVNNNNRKSQKKQIINYQILGEEKKMITQTQNLIEKTLKLEKNLETNAPLTEISQKEKNSSLLEEKKKLLEGIQKNIELKNDIEEKKDNNLIEEDISTENRYFFINTSKICFRCRKPGHFEKTCSEEIAKEKCQNCLGDHQTWLCDSLVCFNCFGIGHKNRDCGFNKNRNKNKQNCNKCNELLVLHKNSECGFIIPQRNQMNLDKADKEKLLCFVCKERGRDHVNCKNISSNIYDNVYLHSEKKNDYQSNNNNYKRNKNIYNPTHNMNRKRDFIVQKMKERCENIQNDDIDSFDEIDAL